ncbi:MAG: M15 family metallopeptidase [Chthoniobacteraceae bacterium]|jgi:D-alanyl-D-alanine dipeptidase
MKHLAASLLCAALLVPRAFCGEPGCCASEPLVEISSVDPTIIIDLRYATSRNVLGHPIYPPGARGVVRRSVADRLKVAQAYLRARGYGLKIWDAFRPFNAQGALWAFAQSARFVADPENGHAMHTWGVAVDATLVDAKGRDVPMPSDLDAFTSAAALHYQGSDPTVRGDLDLLLHAMGAAGFKGMRSEWWHFVAPDWADFEAVTPEQARIFTGGPPVP